MPNLTFDDLIPAQQQPPQPFAAGYGNSTNSAGPEQSFYIWASTPSPVEDEAQNESKRLTGADEPQTATPVQQAPLEQGADPNDQTSDMPPPSQPTNDELRFDDLIPKAPPTMWWPLLGNVSLAPAPGSIPDIYRTDLLDRFNPITLSFQLAAAKQNTRSSANSPFSRPQTLGPVLDDSAPEPLRVGTRYAANVRNLAVTNDTVIDRNTELLLDVLTASVHAMGAGIGPLFGSRVHLDFATRVKGYDLPGIGAKGVEQSFNRGGSAEYGEEGSIRTDVILRNAFGQPIAIYDLKTGNAKLTPSRIKELRDGVGAPNIPVIELRFQAGTAILR